ncbi:MAG: mycothiol system anti-sigma-R factor [Galactobacter sp.]
MCCASAAETATRMERIHEYLNGALSWEDLLHLQEHLAECPECAQQYDLECIIRSVVARSCHESAPATLHSRIKIRIEEIRISEGH